MRLGRRATRVEARAREAGGRGRHASGRAERSRDRSTARLPGGDTRAIAGKGFARRWRDTAKDARERPGETRARATDGETRARTRARSRTPSTRSSPQNPSSVVPSSMRNFERRATGDADARGEEAPEPPRGAPTGRSRQEGAVREANDRDARAAPGRSSRGAPACGFGEGGPRRPEDRSPRRARFRPPRPERHRQTVIMMFWSRRTPFRFPANVPARIRDDVAGKRPSRNYSSQTVIS
jgi:hypothetical protein